MVIIILISLYLDGWGFRVERRRLRTASDAWGNPARTAGSSSSDRHSPDRANSALHPAKDGAAAGALGPLVAVEHKRHVRVQGALYERARSTRGSAGVRGAGSAWALWTTRPRPGPGIAGASVDGGHYVGHPLAASQGSRLWTRGSKIPTLHSGACARIAKCLGLSTRLRLSASPPSRPLVCFGRRTMGCGEVRRS
jgi:hypothetical protein